MRKNEQKQEQQHRKPNHAQNANLNQLFHSIGHKKKSFNRKNESIELINQFATTTSTKTSTFFCNFFLSKLL